MGTLPLTIGHWNTVVLPGHGCGDKVARLSLLCGFLTTLILLVAGQGEEGEHHALSDPPITWSLCVLLPGELGHRHHVLFHITPSSQWISRIYLYASPCASVSGDCSWPFGWPWVCRKVVCMGTGVVIGFLLLDWKTVSATTDGNTPFPVWARTSRRQSGGVAWSLCPGCLNSEVPRPPEKVMVRPKRSTALE